MLSVKVLLLERMENPLPSGLKNKPRRRMPAGVRDRVSEIIVRRFFLPACLVLR